MTKIVINRCYGGFGLSKEAFDKYISLTGKDIEFMDEHIIPRDCPYLVSIVENMGIYANDDYSQLKVVEIPNGIEWEINDYDGIEWVAEKHRRWS